MLELRIRRSLFYRLRHTVAINIQTMPVDYTVTIYVITHDPNRSMFVDQSPVIGVFVTRKHRSHLAGFGDCLPEMVTDLYHPFAGGNDVGSIILIGFYSVVAVIPHGVLRMPTTWKHRFLSIENDVADHPVLFSLL